MCFKCWENPGGEAIVVNAGRILGDEAIVQCKCREDPEDKASTL